MINVEEKKDSRISSIRLLLSLRRGPAPLRIALARIGSLKTASRSFVMYYSLHIIAGTADSFAATAVDYYFSRRVMG